MSYFGKEYIQFFKNLSRNNHKDWFDAHKKDYETFVKKPFQEFTAELIREMKKIDKTISMEPKDAIFRINRDVRFSKDKSPYKLHMAAHINNTSKKDYRNPGIYFQLSAEGIWIGGGVYDPDKETLERIRLHIAGHLSEFAKLLKDKNFVKFFNGEIKGEKNKVIPAEFKAAAEKQPYICNKQFYYMAEYTDTKLILDKNLVKFVADHYRASEPLNNFFRNAFK